MSQYSSGKHAQIMSYGSARPSPEDPMAYPLANPANPILEDYRSNEGHWPIAGYLRSLSIHNSWQWEGIATQNEIEHARAVLKRLVRFLGEVTS